MGKNQDPGSGINIPDPQHCWEKNRNRGKLFRFFVNLTQQWFICHCVGGCWDRTQDCCDFWHWQSDSLATRLDLFKSFPWRFLPSNKNWWHSVIKETAGFVFLYPDPLTRLNPCPILIRVTWLNSFFACFAVVCFMTLTAACIREVVLISWQMTAVVTVFCLQLFELLRVVEDIRLAPEVLEPDPVDIAGKFRNNYRR